MFSVNKIFHWIRSPYSLITLTIILVLHACKQGSFKNYRGGGVNMERGGNMERSISQKLKTISGVSLWQFYVLAGMQF